MNPATSMTMTVHRVVRGSRCRSRSNDGTGIDHPSAGPGGTALCRIGRHVRAGQGQVERTARTRPATGGCRAVGPRVRGVLRGIPDRGREDDRVPTGRLQDRLILAVRPISRRSFCSPSGMTRGVVSAGRCGSHLSPPCRSFDLWRRTSVTSILETTPASNRRL